MRIAVDAMGGDHAPEEIVKGALEFAQDSELLPLRDEYKRLVTANVVTEYGMVDPTT